MMSYKIFPEDIWVNDKLKTALADACSEIINGFLSEDLKTPWHTFLQNEQIGTFCVWLDTEREMKAQLTLDGLVERTMDTNENKEFRESLAQEFERLAQVLRDS